MEKSKIIEAIEEIIGTAEDCKSSYWWAPAGSAAGRRSNERRRQKPEITWSESGHTYTARYDYSESCHHVYASGHYTRDGKKTTLTAIKNSLKRLNSSNSLKSR